MLPIQRYSSGLSLTRVPCSIFLMYPKGEISICTAKYSLASATLGSSEFPAGDQIMNRLALSTALSMVRLSPKRLEYSSGITGLPLTRSPNCVFVKAIHKVNVISLAGSTNSTFDGGATSSILAIIEADSEPIDPVAIGYADRKGMNHCSPVPSLRVLRAKVITRSRIGLKILTKQIKT